MNPLELRTAICNALTPRRPDPTIRSVSLVSPEPGVPVALEVETVDPAGAPRRYRVTVEEI
jgi:hypothetical protein